MHHVIEFITHHWFLVFVTLVAFVLLVREEAFSRGGFGSNLTAQMLTQKINRDNALVVDVRSQELFKKGHIVGSLNMPDDQFDKKMKKLKQHKHRPLIVVCDQGSRSSKRVTELKKEGYDAFTLAGGIASWKRADMPLTTTA